MDFRCREGWNTITASHKWPGRDGFETFILNCVSSKLYKLPRRKQPIEWSFIVIVTLHPTENFIVMSDTQFPLTPIGHGGKFFLWNCPRCKFKKNLPKMNIWLKAWAHSEIVVYNLPFENFLIKCICTQLYKFLGYAEDVGNWNHSHSRVYVSCKVKDSPSLPFSIL